MENDIEVWVDVTGKNLDEFRNIVKNLKYNVESGNIVWVDNLQYSEAVELIAQLDENGFSSCGIGENDSWANGQIRKSKRYIKAREMYGKKAE